ncbi:MAG: hypothetical protein H6728_10065 [Myxococcales bacterium]|nr:hypothetical protein [Myxococcales bacterium]MCB9643407.1 hypothetical protein [Myxococcales bacterium]
MSSFFSRSVFLSLLCSASLGLNLLAVSACGTPTNQEKAAETAQEATPTESTNDGSPQEKAAEPVTEPQAEPAQEPTQEPAKESAPEISPEPQAEAAPEAGPETNPEPNPEATAEATPEASPESQVEATPEQSGPSTPNSSDPAVVWIWLQQQNYRAWTRAPGYATRQTSNAPHGGAVEIFINSPIQQIIDNKTSVTEWPVGSIIVKDGYNSANLSLVAYMEKRSNGWLWFEWNGSGTILYQGQPSICTGCHSSGADYVRAFSFP